VSARLAPLALLLLPATASASLRAPVSPRRLAMQRQVTEARLSPDGRDTAFVTDITGALELWTAPSRGGFPNQLSSLGEQVSDIRYSPDGKTLVFASDFGGDERPDLYLVDAMGGEVEDLTRSTAAEQSPRFSPDGRSLAYVADGPQPFLFQLYTLDLSTRAAAPLQLTHETVSVKYPVWSPDARMIAATRTGDEQKGELMIVDPLGKEEPRVIDPPVGGGIIIPEQFSADSRQLLCRSRNAKGFLQLYLLDPRSGRGRFIADPEWDVDQAVFHPLAGIYFTRNEGGASALYHMRTPEAKPGLVLSRRGRIESFDLNDAGTVLVYLWSDSTHAPDAWRLDLQNGLRSRVTRSMTAGVKPEMLSRAELIRYPSYDGRQVSALFLAPDIFRLGQPPPAVVLVHGGPDWQIYDDFSAERQAFAEAGIAVIAPNFRGSTGFGREWQELNRKDWGGGDRRDLLEAVKYLAKRGDIDPKRVGITGGSFGGYMTLYALARSKGEWAAGAEAYGMPDLAADYELTKDRFAEWYATQMGTPAADPKLFQERSPITYLDDIKAPLLIFQGANDTNVPKAESEQVYTALKDKGRDVELVVYPDEGHGFTKRVNRIDYITRLVDFFTAKLGATPAR
jgi:dipeptidyl aminopeptidase/acylaminoacyl peptidase